jgi:hypothetical protein
MSATVVECYDLDAVALVRSGSEWERTVTGEPAPAFTLSPCLFVVMSIVATLVALTIRRTK